MTVEERMTFEEAWRLPWAAYVRGGQHCWFCLVRQRETQLAQEERPRADEETDHAPV